MAKAKQKIKMIRTVQVGRTRYDGGRVYEVDDATAKAILDTKRAVKYDGDDAPVEVRKSPLPPPGNDKFSSVGEKEEPFKAPGEDEDESDTDETEEDDGTTEESTDDESEETEEETSEDEEESKPTRKPRKKRRRK